MDVDAVSIIALLFVAFPAVIMHYVTKWKQARGLSPDDEKLLQSLFATAQKIEERVNNLERVLEPVNKV